MGRMLTLIAVAAVLEGCSVWPVNQDPDGITLRQDANHIIWALQSYRRDHGSFPAGLNALVPTYMPNLPDMPQLRYRATDGSLSYRYIPTWPQLRPTWCSSIGDSTIWRCTEHTI